MQKCDLQVSIISEASIQQPVKKKQKQFTYSDQYSKYQAYYKKLNLNIDLSDMEQVHNSLRKNKIIKQESFTNIIQVQVVDKLKDSLKILLKWGYFKMEITLLRIFLDLNILNGDQYSKAGQFGKIYNFTKNNKKYTIKTIGFKDNEKILYKQYFIARICSSLKLGPYVFSLFGYDIILFNGQGLFAMQECEDIGFINFKGENKMEEIQIQLSRALYIMHHLHICHCDIKPQNIMFSKMYQKYVFIDFGLSKFTLQKIGFKSWTQFVGTYKYSSPQMKKLYVLQKYGQIDLYYNDLFALLGSFNQIKKNRALLRQNKYFECQDNSKQPSVFHFTNLFTAKFQIFNKNFQKALFLISQQNYLRKSAMKVFLQQFLQRQIQPTSKRLQQQMIGFKNKLQSRIIEINIQEDESYLFYLNRYYDNIFLFDFDLSKQFELNMLNNRQNLKVLLGKYQLVETIFNNIYELFAVQSNITMNENQARRKISLLTLLYDIKFHQQLNNQRKFQVQPTLLYKTQKVLKFFMQNFIQHGNLFQLERIRLIFVHLDNYQAAKQIEYLLVQKFKDNLKKFFILRCKFFSQRRFWSNNISFFSADQYLMQVQQKCIQSYKQDIVMLRNLKQLSINLLSTSLSYESKQKMQKCLLIINQLKKNSILLSQQNQDLQIIQKNIIKFIEILNQYLQKKYLYENILINIAKINQYNFKSIHVSPFLKFGKINYVNLLQFTTEFQKTKKLYMQFFSFFDKGSKLHIYQVQYFLENFSIMNSQFNRMLIADFTQNIKNVQITSFTHANSSLCTLLTYFYKLYQNKTRFHSLNQQLVNVLTKFYQKIITFCSKNKCLPKIDPINLIFSKFYIDLINQGEQASVNHLIQYFRANKPTTTDNTYFFSQAIEGLLLIIKKISYKSQGLNQILKNLSNIFLEKERDEDPDKISSLISEFQSLSNLNLIIFYTFEVFVMRKIPKNYNTIDICNQSTIGNGSSSIAKAMSIEQIRQVIDKFLKCYSLKHITKNYFLSILVLVFFIQYLKKCRSVKLIFNSSKIDMETHIKTLIELNLQKKKRILKLFLTGIDKIQNNYLKNNYLFEIFQLKEIFQMNSFRKKLILFRKIAKNKFINDISYFCSKMKQKVKAINQKQNIINSKLISKIQKIKDLYN